MTVLKARYDVVVVGGGPAGLAAAIGARDAGCGEILIVDREKEMGGILNQCIHSGFGLHNFKEELTGPEYADRFIRRVYAEPGIEILPESFILDISPDLQVTLMGGTVGLSEIKAGAVVLAMGARERSRGAIRTPGFRPAGVMTAGLAQRMVNIEGLLPGRRIAILGSGDIGLIMARRLSLEGCEVTGVYEIMPYCNGLTRNVVQCLKDFDIPLHLSTTMAFIHGRDRVKKVTVAPVAGDFQPFMDRAWDVDCDTILMSIGLIPENELSRQLRLQMDPITGGPRVSSTLETSLPGVFACGNVLHIHDLVDNVSEEALRAGAFAGELAQNRRRPQDNIILQAGDNVRYCLPHTLSPDRENSIYLRCIHPQKDCILRLGNFFEKPLRLVIPSEMIRLTIGPEVLERFYGTALRIDIVAKEDA
ncbi:MAG: NAD(P)/FAD-dependent oxidoreductase [Desulforhopalus sp.]|nr:NAD(P)/FAD-dependent oxidoreductase [Desulforhopalus sp.]